MAIARLAIPPCPDFYPNTGRFVLPRASSNINLACASTDELLQSFPVIVFLNFIRASMRSDAAGTIVMSTIGLSRCVGAAPSSNHATPSLNHNNDMTAEKARASLASQHSSFHICRKEHMHSLKHLLHTTGRPLPTTLPSLHDLHSS